MRLTPARDGIGRLILDGPIERVAAIDQAAHTAAVIQHGLDVAAAKTARQAGNPPVEVRSVAAIKYDVLEDLILDGFAVTAAGVRDALLTANPDGPQRRQAVPARRRIVPTIVLQVPVLTLLGQPGDDGALELPEIDGIAPISPDTARFLCAAAPSFFRVLTHPVTGARLALDRTTYSPPADLRRWVTIRDEYSRFPGSLTPAWHSDIDHIHEWQHHGVTNAENLIALSRDKHVLKSQGLYAVDGDPNGRIAFTSPLGLRHHSDPREPAAATPTRIQRLAAQAGPPPDDCPF